MSKKILWWCVKRFNLLSYFREHVSEYGEPFFIQHTSHFIDHSGYFERVTYTDYNEHTKEFTVRRSDHKNGEKLYIIKVKKSQLYLHAK